MVADPMEIIPVIFTVAHGPTHTRVFPWVGTRRMGAISWSDFFARVVSVQFLAAGPESLWGNWVKALHSRDVGTKLLPHPSPIYTLWRRRKRQEIPSILSQESYSISIR